MKTILVFIDWFLPGYKAGGPVRSLANLIDHFGSRYQFFIITRDTDYCEQTPYSSVRSNKWNELQPGIQVYYFSKECLNRKNMLCAISEIKFDIVYINGIYSWYFSILPLVLLKNINTRIVIAPRGMLSDQALGVKGFKKRIFLWMAKTKGIYKRAIFQSTSEQETRDIKTRINNRAIIKLTPNLPKKSNEEQYFRVKKPGVLRLINIARISPEKNNGYAISLLNKLGEMNVELDLYGPIYDKEYYKYCLDQTKKLPHPKRIQFKGPVAPEEIEKLLTKYHFLLFPSTGENYGHAIFEALAVGVPVIISDCTPWRNLQSANAGWDLPLNNEEKWSAILRKCYDMDQEEYDTLCQGAHHLAQKYMEESDFATKYDELFGIDDKPEYAYK